MDLSKAFDTFNHDLLIAKLKAYSLDLNAASFIKSSLTNRHQRCKIGHSFSEWERNIGRVPQGSILDPVLFSIFINIFLYIENSVLCNYENIVFFMHLGNLFLYLEKTLRSTFSGSPNGFMKLF